MATPKRQAPLPARRSQAQAAIAQYLPLEKTLKDALKLMARFRQAEGFRLYLRRRLPLVIPACGLFVLTSVACAAATVIYFTDTHPLLALPGLILAPFVLVGSLFVQAYVFFSWLENRALAQALGRSKNTPWDFGPLPRMPWGLAAVLLVLPFMILAATSASTAVVLIVLATCIACVFARFDR
jgi:hypothetical protein